MKKADLTQIKHIGAQRMKLLNATGITTIEELYETPLEKLASIKSVGQHYAGLIHEAVNDYFAQGSMKAPETEIPPKKKTEKIDFNFHQEIKNLKKSLNRVIEDLKPLGKKKYLKSFISLKKRSNRLKTQIKKLEKKRSELTQKTKKTLVKEAVTLTATIKSAGKKPKKKTYQKIEKKIQMLTKKLRDISV
jgi:hypothetical protein